MPDTVLDIGDTVVNEIYFSVPAIIDLLVSEGY